ncbi:hypothetical protein GCM10009789_87460 [Kribbella sancticallisti]|uniref:Uncharacterized protein n=1 Tax=Kribbella sancticallisti TaxID=460087 RepID=A0ABP4QWM2_9ACTN
MDHLFTERVRADASDPNQREEMAEGASNRLRLRHAPGTTSEQSCAALAISVVQPVGRLQADCVTAHAHTYGDVPFMSESTPIRAQLGQGRSRAQMWTDAGAER